MKYKAFFLTSIFLVALIPAAVGAQGFPGAGAFASLGLPSFGGLLGGCSAPGCDPKAGGGLALEVGYLGTAKGFTLTQTSEGLPVFTTIGQQYTVPLGGLWLGATATAEIDPAFALYAKGSWLFPANGTADQNEQFGGPDRYTTWNAKYQWYTLEAGGGYGPPGGRFQVVGGFRFDSFMATLTDPAQGFINVTQFDESEIKVTAYIPYVGFVSNAGRSARVGALVFPWVPGTVKFGKTYGIPSRMEFSGSFKNGYFFEAFGEYAINAMGAELGIFGKWTALGANGTAGVSETTLVPVTQTEDFRFSINRHNWIIGGKVALNFTSPM